jgi:hypothetical protein
MVNRGSVRPSFNLLISRIAWSRRIGIDVHDLSTDLGVTAARKIVQASDQEWPAYIDRLRREKMLSAVAHQLNQMLENPDHRQLAIDAFKRIGLWHDDFDMPRRMAVREFGGQLESEV